MSRKMRKKSKKWFAQFSSRCIIKPVAESVRQNKFIEADFLSEQLLKEKALIRGLSSAG